MDPIPLKITPSIPTGLSGHEYPHLFLSDLRGVDIPEEGEIRFRYSRLVKTEREDKTGESTSVELCLKKITDICDCKGRDAEYNEEESDGGPKDAEESLDELMESLDESELEDEGYE